MGSRRPRGIEVSGYRRAIERLARRDHTEREIRNVLEAEGYAPGEIEDAVSRLRESRLIDDGSVAERFARTRLAHYGLGRHRIRQALTARGVTPEAAETGLRSALEELPEAAALDAAARRLWKARSRDEPEKRLRRLFGVLVRRGFPPSLVHERLSALWPRWREAIEGLEDVSIGESEGALTLPGTERKP